jgi:hypothetical protein
MTAADQTVQREKSACHEAVHICLMGADVGQRFVIVIILIIYTSSLLAASIANV